MRRKTDIILSGDQKRIVWHLKTKGPTGRSYLAANLDMHNALVTRLTRELLMLGCVEELDGQLTGRGRPTVPLTISGKAGYSAGAMVHPGWLELVLVDFAGTVLARHREPFKNDDPRAFIELIELRLRELALAKNVMRSRMLGLGVAVAGPVATAGSPNRWMVKWLAGWRDLDLAQFFEDALGVPVWVENEATLAGLAEFYDSGLINDCDSAISFFIGHGVGGGVVSRRDILRGEFGNAGEVGRLFPATKQRPSGIDLLGEINAAGGGLTSLLEIEDCMESHAELIDKWAKRVAKQLLSAAQGGVAWLDPGAVIVSGSLPLTLLDSIGANMLKDQDTFKSEHTPSPRLYVSKIGSWAVSVGAALLPIHDIMGAAE